MAPRAKRVNAGSSSDAGPSSISETKNGSKKAGKLPPSSDNDSNSTTAIKTPGPKGPKKVKEKPYAPSASFPDFSIPLTSRSNPFAIQQVNSTPASLNKKTKTKPVLSSSSLTLVGSPEQAKDPSVPAKRKRPSKKSISSTDKRASAAKASDSDSDLTACSSSSSVTPPSSLRQLARSEYPASPSLTPSIPPVTPTKPGLLSDDDESDGNLSEQDLEKFLASLPDPGSKNLVEEAIAEQQAPFKPSKLPDGVYIDSAVYVKKQGCWWPAKVLGFRPAQTLEEQKAGKDRWHVQDRHGKVSLQPSANVITAYDTRIATCSLGITRTDKISLVSTATTRPPSPPPATDTQNDPPVNPSTFSALDRVQQLRHIRSHLAHLIAETYTPAQWRIEMFFAGKKARSQLSREARYGDIAEDEVHEIIVPELQRWALRGSYPLPSGLPAGPDLRFVRPQGSHRFNELQGSSLLAYIQDILVPEAIIEICIRCFGTEALSAEEQSDDDDDIADEPEAADAEQARTQLLDTKATDPPLNSTHQTYAAARRELDALAASDTVKAWLQRSTELRFARKRMREQLKMPEEGMNEYEEKKWKAKQGMEEGWAGARMRHRVKYAEAESAEESAEE